MTDNRSIDRLIDRWYVFSKFSFCPSIYPESCDSVSVYPIYILYSLVDHATRVLPLRVCVRVHFSYVFEYDCLQIYYYDIYSREHVCILIHVICVIHLCLDYTIFFFN